MSKEDRAKTRKVREFLEALENLSDRYGLWIGGCGCSGSPFIYDIKDKVVATRLEEDGGEYKAVIQ